MKVTYTALSGEEVVIDDEFIFGMVTNSLSIGGFKGITGNVFKGDIALDDGLFEVVLIKFPKNPVELNSILAALAIEDIDTQYMYSFKSGNMLFESAEEISWTLDGEYGGTFNKVQLINDKQAIDIKVKA
jgi:diacylglycerol kinase family enzyme